MEIFSHLTKILYLVRHKKSLKRGFMQVLSVEKDIAETGKKQNNYQLKR